MQNPPPVQLAIRRPLVIADYRELAFWLPKLRRPAFDAYHALDAWLGRKKSNPQLN